MYELYNMLHMLQMLHMKPVIEGCDMCLLTEIVFKDGNYQCKAIVINKTLRKTYLLSTLVDFILWSKTPLSTPKGTI